MGLTDTAQHVAWPTCAEFEFEMGTCCVLSAPPQTMSKLDSIPLIILVFSEGL